jgi:ribosomal protein S18 acetylase RimI-like enzyme
MKIETFACDEIGAERICAVCGADRLKPAEARGQRPDLSLVAVDQSGDRACASVWWRDVPALKGYRVGVTGHYAATDAAAGAKVLTSACDALRAQGATLAVGPIDANTWHRYRLVTWRSADPPFLLEPDNPASWGSHFEEAGFAPLAGYHSACCDDLAALPADAATAARLENDGLVMRMLDPSRIDAELHALWAAACDAFAGNFLYTPVAEEEFRHLYARAIASVAPELVTIAQHAGRIVGFLFAYPDLLQGARGKPVDTVVLKTLGVIAGSKRRGVGRWLFDRGVAAARDAGFRRAIFALIHDDNPSARFGRDQRRLIRRYTLYGRPL